MSFTGRMYADIGVVGTRMLRTINQNGLLAALLNNAGNGFGKKDVRLCRFAATSEPDVDN